MSVRLRTKASGEFDRPNASAVQDLVRAYLAAGLGEEAVAVLKELGDRSPEAVILTEVAELQAGRLPDAGTSLKHPDCLGPQALWRALAHAREGDAARAMQAEKAAGRALERLPEGLRREIAAELGLAAARAGDWDSARRLRAMAARSDPGLYGETGRSRLLDARLAAWEGDREAVHSALHLARGGSPDVAVAATLMLAERVLEPGAAQSSGLDRLIADIGAIARLERGSADGERAAELEARLVALAHGRKAAVELLALGLETGEISEQLFAHALSGLADPDGSVGDSSIASMYLEDPEIFAPALGDRRFRTMLARSLIDLDLPAQAAGIFDGESVPNALLSDLAEAYLRVGDHRAAIAMMAEMEETPLRRQLYERALAMAGGHSSESDSGKRGNPAPGPERLRALARAAIAAGDLERTLQLTLARLDQDASPATAETAVLVAAALGHAQPPEEARAVLAETAPDALARLSGLFRDEAPPSPGEPAAAFLSQLDAEIEAIEDLLEDG